MNADRRFGPRHNVGGRPKVWTADRVLATYRLIAQRLGRTPTLRELATYGGPAQGVAAKLFGSHRRAVELAGLSPRPRGGPIVHGGYIKNGMSLPRIDPAKAAQITAEKRAYWENWEKAS